MDEFLLSIIRVLFYISYTFLIIESENILTTKIQICFQFSGICTYLIVKITNGKIIIQERFIYTTLIIVENDIDHYYV